ncbi:MAG: HAD-IIIA family hydrolase [Ignavibacteriae bacterium]|nr:HAD-IIIA family hydrolase [Ignavibacteriota bacterium]
MKSFFFDRDGIVNKRKIGGYIQSPDEFVFNEDFFDIFSKVALYGYLTVIITNQQGVGKGLMSENALNEIHSEMQRILLEKTGYKFDGIYYCAAATAVRQSKRTKLYKQ